MSRRKHLADRKPCGRLRPAEPSHLLAPTQVRRMLDIAASEARDPLWATMLGRLYLSGKISATEFASGKRWSELYHERISADWLNARNALRLAGRDSERVVGDVCEKDQAPAGLSELGALRDGLSALSDLWAARRKLRASR
jgi:hypothetical protein